MEIIKGDLHNHTEFCDGLCTPQQMAEAAYARGFTDFGFSGHSHAEFDLPCSVRDVAGYLAAIRGLQKEWAGKMRIYCGVEQDFLAPVPDRSEYDYLIGGVHYFLAEDGTYYAIDGTEAENSACIRRVFGGSGDAFCKLFYRQVAENILKYRPDIVAHFDLVVKNNDGDRFFNEDGRHYRSCALEALEVALDNDMILELNTGGMFRGYRRTPYPAVFILREVLRRHGRIVLSSDAHQTEAIAFRFAESLELLREVGFTSVWQWENGVFVEKGIS